MLLTHLYGTRHTCLHVFTFGERLTSDHIGVAFCRKHLMVGECIVVSCLKIISLEVPFFNAEASISKSTNQPKWSNRPNNK